MSRICVVCSKPADFSCGGCKAVSYCGKDHQRSDWKTHKSLCKPAFLTKENEKLGRYLVAARNISKGELIFQEAPYVIGPKAVSNPICLGCHGECGPKSRECDGCGFLLCSVQCQVADAHFDECQIMMKNKFRAKIEPDGPNFTHYSFVVPLRILMMKEKQPEKYEKIQRMQSHLLERMKTPLYAIYKRNVAGFLREALGFTSFDEETILNIAAVLDTNTFEIRLRDKKLRGLYITASLMAHDCVPNTRHTYHGSEFTIAVSATVDIAAGDVISTTYTQTFWGTLERRSHILSVKHFACTCARCADPTELGTYIGAFRCSRCATRENFSDGPKMISTNPLDENSSWQCQQCQHKIPAKLVKAGNENLKEEVARLDKSSPHAMEAFLKKYGVESSGVLHPTNSFVIQVKHALVQMYGNRPGLFYADLSGDLLERKIEYCHQLLEIIDKLNPGFSRIRGQVLSELQAAMVMQSKRLFSEDKVTKLSAQETLAQSMVILAEVTEIMKNEPDAEDLRARLELLAKELDE